MIEILLRKTTRYRETRYSFTNSFFRIHAPLKPLACPSILLCDGCILSGCCLISPLRDTRQVALEQEANRCAYIHPLRAVPFLAYYPMSLEETQLFEHIELGSMTSISNPFPPIYSYAHLDGRHLNHIGIARNCDG